MGRFIPLSKTSREKEKSEGESLLKGKTQKIMAHLWLCLRHMAVEEGKRKTFLKPNEFLEAKRMKNAAPCALFICQSKKTGGGAPISAHLLIKQVFGSSNTRGRKRWGEGGEKNKSISVSLWEKNGMKGTGHFQAR